jgi:RNA polymerase sigma factor (sigma-70 family)
MDDAAPGMPSRDAAREKRWRALAPGARRFDTDERLIAAVRDGSEQAFGVLYDRHVAAVRGLCRYMLGSSEEAQDAVQHAFTAAYVDIMGSRKPIALRPWLLTIARYRCLTVISARRAARVGSLEDWPTPALTLEVDVREDLRAVMDDITRLPDDQRVALVLREIGGASYAEIARILEAPPARVRTLVFQARSSLKTSRRAREIPCAEIRRTLAVSRGGALRRSELRQHLRQCEGCRAVAVELRGRRRGFTSLLPLGPLVAFKRTTFGAFVTSSGGGGTALLSGGVGVKALVTVVIAGGGGVAGVAASGGPDAAPEAPRTTRATATGAAGGASPARDRVRLRTAGSTRHAEVKTNAGVPARRDADRARPAGETVKQPSEPAPAPARAPDTPSGESKPAKAPPVPGGDGGKPATSPAGHDSRPAPQRGADRPPPGQTVAVAHGGGVAGAPGQSTAGAHDQGAAAPPVQPGIPPGAGSVPGQSGGPPGQGSGRAPGGGGGPPG